MQIDHGNLLVRYLKERDVVEIAPSTLIWGDSKATISGEVTPVRDASGDTDLLELLVEGR